MIAVIDVHYMDDASATAGAVVFSGFSDSKIYRTYVRDIPGVDDYVPSQFYKRELPCIMAILRIIKEEIDRVIIHGYVNLGEKPGLGLHLCKALDHKIKVIGVAKKYFRGSNAVKVFRGNTRQPLYVTAVGIKLSEATDLITLMHGKNRLPALLKLADSLSRSGTVK